LCPQKGWLLKNSLAEIAPKNRRARKPYKRFSPTADTFLVTHFGTDFAKREFFNSHKECGHNLTEPTHLSARQDGEKALFSPNICGILECVRDAG
jgi:hypothetical protein